MSKLIILDRDGVINYDSLKYIKSINEFELVPGSMQAIAKLKRAGYWVAIATNQSGIARGYYDETMLNAIHDTLIKHARAAGGDIDKIVYCPHMPDAGCKCRKPSPGMLKSIARHFNCSLVSVPFVGDRVSDIQAALSVNAQPFVVLSSMTDKDALKSYPDVPVFPALSNCVDFILKL